MAFFSTKSNGTMTKEAYVSYETAKLLKEKGFDEPCKSYFIDNVDYIDTSYSTEELTDLHMGVWETLRPTHQMACAWLRKEHHIHIIPEISDPSELEPKYYCMIWNTLTNQSYIIDIFDSYEEAVEVALKYVLENLI